MNKKSISQLESLSNVSLEQIAGGQQMSPIHGGGKPKLKDPGFPSDVCWFSLWTGIYC